MSNGPAAGWLGNVSLGAVVQLVTVAAFLIGNWVIMGERIEVNSLAVRELRTRVDTLDARLIAQEKDYATLNARFESLRETVTELRRQSGLREEPQ